MGGLPASQDLLNDGGYASVVNTEEAPHLTLLGVHSAASWAQLGRRVYQAYMVGWDYHSPTC